MRISRDTMYQGGFTLVELMISMLVSSVIVVAIAFFVADTGRQIAKSEHEQLAKNDLMGVLSLMERDIQRTGVGLPLDAPVQDVLQGLPSLRYELNALMNFSIRDIDPNATGGDGSDELFLGGPGIQLGSSGSLFHIVTDGEAETGFADRVRVARHDGFNVPANYAAGGSPLDPLTVGGSPVEFISIVSSQGNWRVQKPLEISGIAALNNGTADDRLELTYDNAAARANTDAVSQEGDLVFYYRGGMTAKYEESLVPMVRWYLDKGGNRTGTIYRQIIPNPGLPTWDGTSTVPAMPDTSVRTADANRQTTPILSNVVDFQLSYLVWPCQSGGPTWVDHLIDEETGTGEFAAAWGGSIGSYNNNLDPEGIADRYMALRGRLMAVRVSIILEQDISADTAAAAGDRDPTFPNGVVGALTVENHVNAAADFDPDKRYLSIQQTFDPTNLRLKTPVSGLEPFPPIRENAMDAQTFDASNGFCKGKIAS